MIPRSSAVSIVIIVSYYNRGGVRLPVRIVGRALACEKLGGFGEPGKQVQWIKNAAWVARVSRAHAEGGLLRLAGGGGLGQRGRTSFLTHE